MTPDRDCRKKDKRLLVLLAFGTLIIFLNNEGITLPEKTFFQSNWLEIKGERAVLYRLSKPEHLFMLLERNDFKTFSANDQKAKVLFAERMKKNKVVGVKTGNRGSFQLSSISPRLSFFLGQRLPINKADGSELSLVPGIGPSLSGNIIQYRKNNGRIENKQELFAVPGIGRLRAEKLAQFITFE